MTQRAHYQVGERIGRWTVQGLSHYSEDRHFRMIRVKCDCGSEKVRRESLIRFGDSRSCGCLIKEACVNKPNARKHGMRNSPEYRTYAAAKARCRNPNTISYPNYGGRGIEFRFESFEEFYQELGPKPSADYSINRIDNDGHYEKGNVEWATRKEQRRNRRSN
jgi:hypothetical protein